VSAARQCCSPARGEGAQGLEARAAFRWPQQEAFKRLDARRPALWSCYCSSRPVCAEACSWYGGSISPLDRLAIVTTLAKIKVVKVESRRTAWAATVKKAISSNLAAASTSVERLDARRTHAAPEWPAPSHTPPATYSYGHLATRI
jgi:hypothetical protein